VIDVTTRTEINLPRREVSEFAGDPGNTARWYKNIESVEWLTDPPARVGSRLRFSARFLGRTLSYVYEIREVEPGVRLVMTTAEGPFPMETTYAWQDAGPGRTRMMLRNRGRPSGFARISAPIMSRAVGRANRADLRRLKQLLESRPVN
jgi:uncharacterized membrane protein